MRRRYWTLAGILTLFWILALAAAWLASRRTGGVLVYGLDDAYIHMAMAKNLAGHMVFGVTPYAYTASSSSPLWTLLLAMCALPTGVPESLPFILNLLFGSLIVVLSSHILRKGKLPGALTTGALILIIVGTPLIVLAQGGMEHSLHGVLLLLFAWISARSPETGPAGARRQSVLLLVLAGILPLVRMESYALILFACAWMTFRGRWRLAVGMALCSTIPLAAFQLIAYSHGWPWLPNSILLRLPSSLSSSPAPAGDHHEGVSLFFRFVAPFVCNARSAPELPAVAAGLVGISLFLGVRRRDWAAPETLFGLLAAAAVVLHLLFGKVGHLYRYEAYLYPLHLVALVLGAHAVLSVLGRELRAYQAGLVIVLAVIGILIGIRGVRAVIESHQASVNIYEQQYQMARFVREAYDREGVALNDIGAVSFFSHARIVDLAGLASIEVASAKRNNSFGPELIRSLAVANGVQFAVLYEEWFQNDGRSILPAEWEKVEEWEITENVICSHECVAFFGIDRLSAATLRRRLDGFAGTLPATVVRRTIAGDD